MTQQTRGFLLAPLVAPAVIILYSLASMSSPLDLPVRILLPIVLGVPFSYLGSIVLGVPLVMILGMFGKLLFWRVIVIFAFVGAVTYWFSVFCMRGPKSGWFDGSDSLPKEILGIGVPLGVLVGATFCWISGITIRSRKLD